MRKCRRYLSLLLACVLAVSLLPAQTLAATVKGAYTVLVESTIKAESLGNPYQNVNVVDDKVMRYDGSRIQTVNLSVSVSEEVYGFTSSGYAQVDRHTDQSVIINATGAVVYTPSEHERILNLSDDGYLVVSELVGNHYIYTLVNLNTGEGTTQDDWVWPDDIWNGNNGKKPECYNNGLLLMTEFHGVNRDNPNIPPFPMYSYHYEDLNENVVIDDVWAGNAFSNGYAVVQCKSDTEYYSAIIDKTGRVVLSDKGKNVSISGVGSDGMVSLQSYSEPEGRTYAKLADGLDNLSFPTFAKGRDFCNGYAVVRNEEYETGLIDTKGNEIIPFGHYKSLSNASTTGLVWAIDKNDYLCVLKIGTATEPGPGLSKIVALSPANGATDVGYAYDGVNDREFLIKFDREVPSDGLGEWSVDVDVSSSGGFAIYRALDDQLITSPEYSIYSIATADKSTLSIRPSFLVELQPNTAYYITVGEGLIRFADGTVNPAITKGQWRFTTKEKLTVTTKDDFMGIDSFSFQNQPGFFGDNRYTISDEYYKILKSKLSTWEKFVILTNKTMDSMNTDFGECFGMAAVMALMHEGSLTANTFEAGAKNAFNLTRPSQSKRVASLIYYYQLLQSIAFVKEEDTGKSQREMGKELVDALRGGAKAVIINFTMKEGDHSIVAYALDEDSNPDEYIIYCADSNALIIPGDNKWEAADPSIFYIRKSDYTVGLLKAGTNGQAFHILKLISIISDLTPFEYYNPSSSLRMRAASGNISSYSHLTTTAPFFTIMSGEKSATVDGDTGNITGDLTIYPTFSNIAGESDKHYSYLLDPADSYFITYPDGSEAQDTLLVFSASTGNGGFVSSNATYIVFNSDGAVSIENAAGASEVSIIADSVYDSWWGLTATVATSDLVVLPQEENCEFRSKNNIGEISVAGISDWNNFTLSAEVNDNCAYLLEEKQGDGSTYLVLTDEEETQLGGSPVTYSVVYMTRGGSFVDAALGVPYNSMVTSPASPTYAGYTFSGWYKDSECSAGQEWNFSKDVVVKDTVLYAKWTYVGTSTPSDPGGGGYNPPATPYGISVPAVTGGTVSVSPTSASAGSTVAITTTPDTGYELAVLTVSDASGKTIGLTDKGNGQYSFKMPNGKVSINAEFRPIDWNNPFTDVARIAWYYDAVKFVSVNGLMNGAGGGFFAPNVKLSRAMLAQILYNREGRPAVTGGSAFSDVQPGAWYADAVSWAAGKGIITGYGNGMFGPDDGITREQVAVMLYRYADSPVPPNLALMFSDAYKVSDWARDAVRWAVDQGILNGKGNGVLDPTGTATRAEAAQMLKNYFDK